MKSALQFTLYATTILVVTREVRLLQNVDAEDWESFTLTVEHCGSSWKPKHIHAGNC